MPGVALGKAFAEGFWSFAEGQRPSANHASPVVIVQFSFVCLFACGWKLTSRSVRFVPGFVCMLYSCCSLAACVSCRCMNPVFTACRRPRQRTLCCVFPITTDAVWIGQTVFPSPVRSCLFLPRVVGHICAPKATSLVVVLPDWSIPNPRNPIGAVEQMVAWSSAC